LNTWIFRNPSVGVALKNAKTQVWQYPEWTEHFVGVEQQ
jgi:hypothetical protein